MSDRNMQDSARILLVVDQPENQASLERKLRRGVPNLSLHPVSAPQELSHAIDQKDFDLAITEGRMRWTDGLAVLRAIKARCPDCPVIMVADSQREPIAEEALKAGLHDFVVRSSRDFRRLSSAVHSALELSRYRIAREQAETRYRSLFENVPVGLYLSTPSGEVLDANSALVQMLGYPSRESLLAINAAEGYARVEDRTRWRELIEREGVVRNFETQMRRPDGQLIWVELSVRAVRAPDGSIWYYEGSMADVTARKRAEEALRTNEERYHDLFENANDIVYTHDLKGNFTSISKSGEHLTGYTREETLRMNIAEIVAPEYLETAGRMIEQKLIDEKPTTYELAILAKDGTRLALEVSTRLVFRDGKPVGVQGIARDITSRKKTEEALRQAKEKLQTQVRELEQHAREIALLSEMGDLLRACMSAEEAYAVIGRIAPQLFPGQAGSLCVISPSRNVVEAVSVWGGPLSGDSVFAPDDCWALRRGRIHIVDSPNVDLSCRHLRQPLAEKYLCVPMIAHSQALGILHLSQRNQVRLPRPKQRLAATVADHIAMALSNLRLQETLRNQSIRDSLTGLFNRRFMEESLERDLRRAVRNQRPLGLVMLDIDHFKQFNDTFGHEAGDEVLRQIGVVLRSNIRGEDIACRYGGEEFTVILPEGSSEVTRHRAERLRDAVRSIALAYRGQQLGRVTISLGVAVFPEHGPSGDALLRAADAALYRAKAEGRDRVVVSE